ncbi:lipase [Streptomyces sp. 3MP-14]|uniref:Lipase n=1 Tax=Streptomyces mimosae TaxID=2586635 RepID=A0A5N6A3U0_9ACTN|nr:MULTISPECIES: lipase [Streptomyces]KAB8163457.1 lipase [Streptomyces mimosae]KAB8174734.1 lipase [Streptomyces sp. 3MP-14]
MGTRTGGRAAVGTVAVAIAVALVAAGAAPAFAEARQQVVSDAGAGSAGQRDHARGALVAAEPFFSLPGGRDAAAELTAQGFDARATRHGVDVWRLTYLTVDAHGQRTTASGLLALPRTQDRRLRVVSYAHGTEVHRGSAPSVNRGFATAPVVAYASAGYATVAPDYLGMGLGPGPHPWMDVPSETTASLDLLRAAREFSAGEGRELRREVLVTGFSQGASAALGLGRALQARADGWFRLGALAPVSGAYDFGGSQLPALLAGEVAPEWAVAYTAYLLVAFDRSHDVYDAPGDVFRAPYAETVEELFNGEHTGQEVMAGLPGSLSELLTGEGLALLAEPNAELAGALAELDSVCVDWAPRAPITLWQARGDEQAVDANTAACLAALRANGVRAGVRDLGPVDHEGSRHIGSHVAAIPEIIRWFDRLA